MIYQYPAQQTNLLTPIHSWDVLAGAMRQFFSLRTLDLQVLNKYRSTLNWEIAPELLDKIGQNRSEAIVLTDKRQAIIWVNNQFTDLTGYKLEEAKGKNPNFLQGERKDPLLNKQLRENLKNGESFTQTVLNFSKSGKAYHCYMTIYPIFNKQSELVNYLAFENETDSSAA